MAPYMKPLLVLYKIGTFESRVMQFKSAATPMPSSGFQATIKNFKIRYCKSFSLKGYKTTTSYKSRVTTLLNKNSLLCNFFI